VEWVVVGLVAGMLTSTSFLPQIVRGWRTKRLGDVSPTMLGVMLSGLVLWLAYGLAIHDMALIVANLIGLVLTGTLALLWVRYGRGPRGAGA
jgi:MtN3 and saliva related transmembrane protein